MGTEGPDDGVVAAPPAWAPALECTHPEDVALHADICAWAEEWAKRLIAEAPAPTDVRLAHPAISVCWSRAVEVCDSIPERLRVCRMADHLLVLRAINHLGR